MTGTWLGLAAAALVVGAWAFWMRRLNQVRIPRDRTAFLAIFGLGVVLGIAAFVSGVGILGGVTALLGILGGGMFLGLRLQSSQAAREPAVSLGSPVIDLSAPDDSGEVFQLASLRGRPVLLKFFRGHW